MVKIKEYAEEHGVSYEAVRSQIKRYSTELSDHIIKKGRTQYLDEDAVAFLDEKRKENPIVVVDNQLVDQIKSLQEENSRLRDQIIALLEKNNDLLEKQSQLLLEDHQYQRTIFGLYRKVKKNE